MTIEFPQKEKQFATSSKVGDSKIQHVMTQLHEVEVCELKPKF